MVGLLRIAMVAVLLLRTAWASAAALQAPVGGAPVPIPTGKVVCGTLQGGWTVESGRTHVRPPTDLRQVGRSQDVTVASYPPACLTSKETVTLTAVAPLPNPDARSVELMVDEGRLDLRGTDLEGSELHWQARGQNGRDTCAIGPSAQGQQTCSYAVGRKLPADSMQITLSLLPAGARPGVDTYDAAGHLLPSGASRIFPARIVISSPLPREQVVDVSKGEARLEIAHPEAIAGVDCSPARCELSGREILIRAVIGPLRTLPVRLRLVPHVMVRQGDLLVGSASASVDLAYCPLSVSSGPPLRDLDDLRVVVRLDRQCGASARDFHWTANGNPAGVLEVENEDDVVYVLLGVGRVSGDRLAISATRPDKEASVVALTTSRTMGPPRLRTSLELVGYGDINFIPTNREAVLAINALPEHGALVPLPIEGVYTVQTRGRQTRIRGVAGAGGYVALRFAYRDPSLPGRFAKVDLAHLADTVQRPLEQANIPAPIGASMGTAGPVVELMCAGDRGRFLSIRPGSTYRLPFSRRDSCRVVIHRQRIRPEDGEQRLNLDLDVTSAAGSARPEGHVSHRLIMRHGDEDRVVWIHGVQSQYDRISARVTHVLDETQYLRGQQERLELPAAQWSVVVADTHFRFYATAAIPVSLFRFSNDPGGLGTGSLSLNVGMLSRLTWLTSDGTEGLLGLEAGVMGMGLASDNDRQLNLVGGLSFSVPLGNLRQPTQAALNVHAWAAYRLGPQSGTLETGEKVELNQWAFIFGPSITIGNVGLDL